ncbi:hypothetical protein AB0C18_43405, partial [Nonomuraea muscovyensis]
RVLSCGRPAVKQEDQPATVGIPLVYEGEDVKQGIFHEYYTVALAPAIAALVGAGVALAWERRACGVLAGVSAVTAGWAYVLLARSADWNPWLGPAVLVCGLVVAAGLLVAGRYAPSPAGAEDLVRGGGRGCGGGVPGGAGRVRRGDRVLPAHRGHPHGRSLDGRVRRGQVRRGRGPCGGRSATGSGAAGRASGNVPGRGR